MSANSSDDDSDYGTITIGDITDAVSDQFSVWNSVGDDITITTGIHINDRTPVDPVEEAELKLQGICPACRNPVEDHLWDCKHQHHDIGGYTLDVGSQWNFSTHSDPTITIGSTIISEERMKKLNRIADALDDDMLDRLDEIIDKLKEQK